MTTTVLKTMKTAAMAATVLAMFATTSCRKSDDDTATPAATASITTTQSTALIETPVSVTIANGTFSGTDYTATFQGGVTASTAKATITKKSSTELSVTVPDGATTGKITVTDNAASGSTFTTTNALTVTYPVSAGATVTKVADLPGIFTNTNFDHLHMTLYNGDVYINSILDAKLAKLNTTTGALSFVSSVNLKSIPEGLLSSGDGTIVSSSSTGGIQIYRYGNLTTATATGGSAASLATSGLYDMKTADGNNIIGADINNKLYSLTWSTTSSNTASTYTATLINSDLYGIPGQSDTAIAMNGSYTYVFANNTLWKLTSTKTLQKIAGSPGVSGYVDGAAADARFNNGNNASHNPISVDSAGNVYVLDCGNFCIRKVDTSGNVTTVAGNPNKRAYTGKGNQTWFFAPEEILQISDKKLYVISYRENPQSTRYALYQVDLP